MTERKSAAKRERACPSTVDRLQGITHIGFEYQGHYASILLAVQPKIRVDAEETPHLRHILAVFPLTSLNNRIKSRQKLRKRSNKLDFNVRNCARGEVSGSMKKLHAERGICGLGGRCGRTLRCSSSALRCSCATLCHRCESFRPISGGGSFGFS